MKTRHYISIALGLLAIGFVGTACSDDSNHVGDDVFNDESTFPYVFIQDRNEDMEDIPGNNFWGDWRPNFRLNNYILTSEEDDNQVRIDYDTQDNNILSHQVIVGFDSDNYPPADGVVLMTLTEFPQNEVIITKQDIANTLGVSVESLTAPTVVYFGGISEDNDGNIVSNPDDFELYLRDERHAYFYQWQFE